MGTGWGVLKKGGGVGTWWGVLKQGGGVGTGWGKLVLDPDVLGRDIDRMMYNGVE